MSADPINATIMIVDDEPENLNVLGEMLRREGGEVRAFPRGEMALATAREDPPDLVLLDVRMPGLDGYEVCRRFKADDRLRLIPIIFLSASASTDDKLRAFETGGADYVTKPFAEIEVLARSRAHLRLSQHQRHLEHLVRERVRDLAEAHRRLRVWDDAKTQWLNTLSHEMRTPLTGVFGITDLLFMDLPEHSDHHALRKDYDQSRLRVEKLIDDALALAQIDVAEEDFTVSPIRIKGVLQAATDTVAARAPDIRMRADVTAVDAIAVGGQYDLMRRAFVDLLQTAAHCVHPGESVTLETRVADGQARVTISTGGKSLPPESLETFFDVGGQRTLLKGGGDFGLGSALAARIVRLFNGRVSVCNGPERGIVLEVALPLDNGSSPEKGGDR
jgi:DNA-binding response OmpR family regulator